MSRKVNRAQIYRDKSGGYRWRLVAKENGLVIGSSSESYVDRIDAIDNLNRVIGISDVATEILRDQGDELHVRDEGPDSQADEDEETEDNHAIRFPADATLAGPLYCDFCGAAVVLDRFPEEIGGQWIHIGDWKAKQA